jgi:hypothetical protein
MTIIFHLFLHFRTSLACWKDNLWIFNKMEVQDPKMMKFINIELREILGPIKRNNTMLN